VRFDFTAMCGAFGLLSDSHPTHFPVDRICERWPRLDIFWLSRIGALAPGTSTEVEIEGTGEGLRPSRRANVLREGSGAMIDGVLVRLIWDSPMESVERPWFACPDCGRRCRHVYLCDGAIACRRCHGLDYASRHLRRQTPAVGRVERLRRRLGGCEAKPFAPLPTRVRRGRGGRSKAFHDSLVARILDEEAKLVAHLGSVVRDLARRIRVRKERGKW
jgi:hypothetical protein